MLNLSIKIAGCDASGQEKSFVYVCVFRSTCFSQRDDRSAKRLLIRSVTDSAKDCTVGGEIRVRNASGRDGTRDSLISATLRDETASDMCNLFSFIKRTVS